MYRKATLDDCKSVYSLICEMEDKTLPYDKFSSIFQTQLDCEHYYCMLCELNGNVIGILNLRFEEQLHHAGQIAEIMEFAIASPHRKQGLGKEMFAAACQISKEFGCVQIEVACNQLREDTHRFYIREGMHNFHFKFSKPLTGNDMLENALGR